ncbi:YeiH family protein, partial [Senegalimassilia anaerobia]|uniref:YeiH family protein n=1 Tax=Senegalimassilia anaerobia TaxID=1473216 RepID=UPI003A9868D8
MSHIKTLAPGIAVSALIAVVCWFLGQAVPLVGGAVFAILLGMVIGTFWKEKGAAEPGVKFASKKILQTAVVLLGFGLPLTQLAQVGVMSLPVILSTISASLITAAVLCRVMHVPGRTATLIGVGSSICGGSAIAATAPVIKADDQEVAHAISVVFL